MQAQWYVKAVRPFSESEVGEIELVRWKARSGGLPRVHRFEVGDAAGSLPFKRLDPDLSPEGRVDAAIIDALKAVHPESCSQRDVEAAVEGTATMKRDRLKALAEDPQRPVRGVESGQHVRYSYAPDADREPADALARSECVGCVDAPDAALSTPRATGMGASSARIPTDAKPTHPSRADAWKGGRITAAGLSCAACSRPLSGEPCDLASQGSLHALSLHSHKITTARPCWAAY